MTAREIVYVAANAHRTCRGNSLAAMRVSLEAALPGIVERLKKYQRSSGCECHAMIDLLAERLAQEIKETP